MFYLVLFLLGILFGAFLSQYYQWVKRQVSDHREVDDALRRMENKLSQAQARGFRGKDA